MKVRYKAALCCIEGGGLISGCSCDNPIHEYVYRETDHLLPGDEIVDTTPSQGLDAATVERCARVAEELADAANTARCANAADGDDNGEWYYAGQCRSARSIATQIRALATDPHQHGAGNGEKYGG